MDLLPRRPSSEENLWLERLIEREHRRVGAGITGTLSIVTHVTNAIHTEFRLVVSCPCSSYSTSLPTAPSAFLSHPTVHLHYRDMGQSRIMFCLLQSYLTRRVDDIVDEDR